MLSTTNLDINIGGKLICHAANLKFEADQIWAILGANGAGKTTLLHTLCGLRPPDAGNIYIDSKALSTFSAKARARKIGLLFQDHADPLSASVLETVLTGRHPFLAQLEWENQADIQLAEDSLAAVGMLECAQRQINSLSGGERKRVAIATLLTQAPSIWLLDEPSNHLDLHHQITALALLTARIHSAQQVAIMSMHDVNLAQRYCTHALLLFDNGELQAGTIEASINSQTLEKLYHHPIRMLEDKQNNFFFPA